MGEENQKVSALSEVMNETAKVMEEEDEDGYLDSLWISCNSVRWCGILHY